MLLLFLSHELSALIDWLWFIGGRVPTTPSHSHPLSPTPRPPTLIHTHPVPPTLQAATHFYALPLTPTYSDPLWPTLIYFSLKQANNSPLLITTTTIPPLQNKCTSTLLTHFHPLFTKISTCLPIWIYSHPFSHSHQPTLTNYDPPLPSFDSKLPTPSYFFSLPIIFY